MAYLFVFQTARIVGANCKYAVEKAIVEGNQRACNIALHATQDGKPVPEDACPLDTQMPVWTKIKNAMGTTVGILYFISFVLAIAPILWWLNAGETDGRFFVRTAAFAVTVTSLNVVMFIIGMAHSSGSASVFFLLVKDAVVLMVLTMVYANMRSSFTMDNFSMPEQHALKPTMAILGAVHNSVPNVSQIVQILNITHNTSINNNTNISE